jgi:hypothetical protein
MSFANRVPEPASLYRMDDLREIRRGVLLYARSFPVGSERNQHRQIALSLRRLFKNNNWLATHTLND